MKMKIKRFEFNPLPVNCYILWDETNEAVVIDPGCSYDSEKQALKDFIVKNNLQLKHLLNTHLHPDHVLGNAFVEREFGLKTEANKADEYWLESMPQQSRSLGLEYNDDPVHIGIYLNDGDIVKFGNTTLECILVPGHSPGGLVFYCKLGKCMFSGDVLFQGSVGRADLAGGNFDDLIEHIQSRLFTKPNDVVVYPGHGAPTTIGMEKAENPFFRNTTNL
jgi:glyoxylase-like metal-dependent hydrolase (beta-lactamase superfamily II)